MARRPIIATEETLIKAPLPKQTETYTVISHKYIIDKTEELSKKYGLNVNTKFYKSNDGATMAQGVCNLTYDKDPDLGMMFAWVNSYDKSLKFGCATGAYVNLSNNRIIGNDACSWVRKHTGAATEEVEKTIEDQMSNAEAFFRQLMHDKDEMKKLTVTEKERAELVGRMYFVNELLTTEQMTIIKEQFKNSSHNYGLPDNNLWVFYNAILYAFHKSHPKYWMEQQRIAHLLVTNHFKIAPLALVDAQAIILSEKTGKPIPPKPGDQLEITQDPTYKERDEVKGAEDVIDAGEEITEEVEEVSSTDTPTEVIEETVTEEVIEEEIVEEVTAAPEPVEEVIEEPVTEEPDNEPLPEDFSLDFGDASSEEPVEVKEKSVETPKSDPIFELDEDNSWPCLNCGEIQGAEAIFYDGQLCEKCHTK